MTDELDELERHVRSLWPDLNKPRPALADEDRAVAAKLLGKDNFRRLSKAKSGERVKYRAPTRRAEYHCFPSATTAGVEHWVITMIENGRRRPLDVWLTYEKCMLGVRWLEGRGIPVTRADTEYMRSRAPDTHAKPPPERSKRFELLAELGSFRR